MARYDFTARAVEDLKEIGRYTRKTWGLEQTHRYREELEIAFQKLSLSPNVGHKRDAIAAGVRSFTLRYVARPEGETSNSFEADRLFETLAEWGHESGCARRRAAPVKVHHDSSLRSIARFFRSPASCSICD